jgi:hypothetical protein
MSSEVDPKKPPGYVFSDEPTRTRAAAVCACRARNNRHHATGSGSASDALTVLGVVGTVGGGSVSGVAATLDSSERRKTVATAGLISLGLGALAFGIGSALDLPKRGFEADSAAEDQEYATAVLLNNQAGLDQWSRAWAICVKAESLVSAARPMEPSTAFQQKEGENQSGTQIPELKRSSIGSALPPANGGE